MSMLIHRCPECGHGQHEHFEGHQARSGNCSFGWCPCSLLRDDVLAEPVEVIRTFLPGGAESPSRLGPGDLIDHGFAGKTEMCACDACVAAFSGAA